MPRRRACASSSAARSASHLRSRVRADTRARPLRTSVALTSSPVSQEHIEQSAAIGVASRAVTLESHPAVQHARLERFTRFDGERRWTFEGSADFRGIDAEQPNAPDTCRVQRVAVEHSGDDCHDAAVVCGCEQRQREHERHEVHTSCGAERGRGSALVATQCFEVAFAAGGLDIAVSATPESVGRCYFFIRGGPARGKHCAITRGIHVAVSCSGGRDD